MRLVVLRPEPPPSLWARAALLRGLTSILGQYRRYRLRLGYFRRWADPSHSVPLRYLRHSLSDVEELVFVDVFP